MYRHIAHIAALCAILVGTFSAAYEMRMHTPSAQYALEPGALHLRETGKVFADDIRVLGGQQAYRRFGVAVRDFGIDDQHAYAHQFGHELYKIEGEKGVSVCDARYGLGCFHQFLGDAIADLGTSSVPRLYDECARTTGTHDVCKHGLGHGVLAGFGYTFADLQQALALCDSVTHEETYSGCAGGAFMEYSMRTIALAEGTMDMRPPTDGSMYEPCPSVGSADRKTCTFWLPEWWFWAVLHGDRQTALGNDAYTKMAPLCAASAYPQTCYEGIGYITPTAFGFDPQKVRDGCDTLGNGGRANVYCRGMAALIFHLTYPENIRAATQICDGLDGTDADVCAAYAAHDRDFSFTLPDIAP